VSAHKACVTHEVDEPPPKFRVGDRVRTSDGGAATVVDVCLKWPSYPRMYIVAQDGGCNRAQSERALRPLTPEPPAPPQPPVQVDLFA
jgi:hypothetical protein